MNSRIAEVISKRIGVLPNIGHEDLSKTNIFNETHHNAVRYCEIERKFDVYNSIFNISKIVDRMQLSEFFSS